MDRRLQAAAYAGDVGSLRQLLQQDRLILHRPIHTCGAHPSDNPLHVAAALGHSAFTREVVSLNPELAHATNGHGLYPLHLAAANGHVLVVRDLLELVGSDLCFLCDKDGMLPLHVAVINGKARVVDELLKEAPESVRDRTAGGDTVLHLAVKSNCFALVERLVEMVEEEGNLEMLLAQDRKGNNMLHLATTRRQLEILKVLLGKPWVDVNATNLKGLTVLDVLLESSCEHGDLLLGEMIHASGGRVSTEANQIQRPTLTSISTPYVNIMPAKGTSNNCRSPWRSMLTFIFKYPLASVGLGYLAGFQDPDAEDSYKTTPDTLLIVSTLIATITFQGGLNPPGGFATGEENGKDPLKPGQALIASSLEKFVHFDIIALVASLSVILVLISAVPKWKVLIRILMWITWVSFFFTGLAFDQAIFIIFPDNTSMFRSAWNLIAAIFTVWLCIWFTVYMLKKGRWLNDWKHVCDERKDGILSLRIVVGTTITLAIIITAGILYSLKTLP